MPDFEVITPRPVRPLIDALAGKRAGYRAVFEQLARDPCAKELGAYRLSGPLAAIVCGVHLKRSYRLAFTMQAPCCDDGLPEVPQEELDAFLDELQRMTRGRRSVRGRP